MLGDIPPCSFGYNTKWHFLNDIDFFALFDQTFLLPSKNSWAGFCPTNEVAMKVTLKLLLQESSNGQVEVSSRARMKIWAEWKTYCRDVGVPPCLDNCDFGTVARVATMSGGRIRKGKRGKVISTGSIQTRLGDVNTTITLDISRPLHQKDRVHYIKPTQHMLAFFINYTAPTEKKLACHPGLPSFACAWGHRKGITVPVSSRPYDHHYFLFLTLNWQIHNKMQCKKTTCMCQFQEESNLFTKSKRGDISALPRTTTNESIHNINAATFCES